MQNDQEGAFLFIIRYIRIMKGVRQALWKGIRNANFYCNNGFFIAQFLAKENLIDMLYLQ